MKTLNPYLAVILDELDNFLSSTSLTDEYQIIKHFQVKKIPPFEYFDLASSKGLFSAHFLCMHALYHLKAQYQREKKFSLDIQSVRVEKTVSDQSLVTIENSQTLLETVDPLADYYLDAKHYFETQADEINDMLKSFWQRYIAQDQKQAALATLELPPDVDAKKIKAQYLRLAQKYHPDKGGCAEVFTKIHQAKVVLDKLY